METKKKHELSLAKRMAISLVCGLVAGLAFMFLREHLNASGQAQTWTTINNLLFQDITADGAERAFGIFYIIGQLFIKALQLVIIPMVFTSISLAIGSIADIRTMGRISAKTLFWFLLCSFLALLLAGCVGYGTYSMGLFNTHIEGLAEASGSTGSNPLNVVLNIIPSNIITAFGSNGAVLSSVFLAVAIGLSMNTLGESRTATLRRLLGEVNDVVVVFLNFIVSNFAPFAVFVLLTRTFAIYGIDYLKPALVYVVVTVVLLLAFLIIAYPLVIALGAKLDPFTFIRKIANVAVFGFFTSSSAATLPLNIKVCEEEFGVDESIASFVLPLGMTINMDGTAIMQVIATVFIAGCAGYTVTPGQLVVVALLALLASVGTPAAPGAGAVILFTILSGMGFVNDGALLAYSLILAINRPIEMLVTSLNVVGDAVASICVARSEGLLNEKTFNDLIPNFYERSAFLREIGREDLALLQDYFLYKRLLLFYTAVCRSQDPKKKEHKAFLQQKIEAGKDCYAAVYGIPQASGQEYRKMKLFLKSPILYRAAMRLNDSFLIPIKVAMANRRQR